MIKHIVNEGQNIKQIAVYYDIPAQVLIDFNDLKNIDDFSTNQVIYIPTPKEYKERIKYKSKKEGK